MLGAPRRLTPRAADRTLAHAPPPDLARYNGTAWKTDFGIKALHLAAYPASSAIGSSVHSIAVDPRDPRRMLIAVSTAGVLETTDGGATWHGRNRGMLNDYLPDPAAEWGHDPHFVTQCPGDPDRLWQQNHSGVFTSVLP